MEVFGIWNSALNEEFEEKSCNICGWLPRSISNQHSREEKNWIIVYFFLSIDWNKYSH